MFRQVSYIFVVSQREFHQFTETLVCKTTTKHT